MKKQLQITEAENGFIVAINIPDRPPRVYVCNTLEEVKQILDEAFPSGLSIKR